MKQLFKTKKAIKLPVSRATSLTELCKNDRWWARNGSFLELKKSDFIVVLTMPQFMPLVAKEQFAYFQFMHSTGIFWSEISDNNFYINLERIMK